uniref:Uncharacterized protein n=1 Tax=uncultured Acidobacteriales bacterium HF0200_23L05 TaxID=710732 RepID=E0XUM2_9BACT|nr:hypothetical protein [uncultured Acidobacteriales bacterium HF0200_23L05]
MRHAASVDSEPGSNSQVEYVSLRSPKGPLDNWFNTRAIRLLRCITNLVSG